MKKHLILQLEGDTIRFTPNGRIAVIDAIGALSEADCPSCVWEALKRSHPDVAGMCTDYNFPGEMRVPVADSGSWEKIREMLLDHMIDAQTG